MSKGKERPPCGFRRWTEEGELTPDEAMQFEKALRISGSGDALWACGLSPTELAETISRWRQKTAGEVHNIVESPWRSV